MASPEVRRPPLHRPHDEVTVSDDRGYPVLHEPVPEGDERLCQAPLHQRTEGGFEVRGLEGDEGEVEGILEVVRVGVGVEADAALLAQIVEEEAGVAQLRGVLLVGVEDGHAPHGALHLRGRHAADGAGPDYQDARFDHGADPASTGGRSFKSSFNAA